MALLHQSLCGGAAFDYPDAVQETIDAHWFSA
jgi:hypothetical protein